MMFNEYDRDRSLSPDALPSTGSLLFLGALDFCSGLASLARISWGFSTDTGWGVFATTTRIAWGMYPFPIFYTTIISSKAQKSKANFSIMAEWIMEGNSMSSFNVSTKLYQKLSELRVFLLQQVRFYGTVLDRFVCFHYTDRRSGIV